jgi:hypothetical protein
MANAIETLEERLLKAAEGYKGTANIKQQLLGEAAAAGVIGQEAVNLVSKVLSRLQKTETGAVGKTLGKAQDPNDRWRKLAARIQQLRSY